MAEKAEQLLRPRLVLLAPMFEGTSIMFQQGTKPYFGRKNPSYDQRPSPSVLIVEDQPLLAEYMAVVADELGWKALTAGSVKGVEQTFEEHHPAVLVLDLGLPDGDGVELLRYLSRMDYAGAILIVSSFDDGVIESCGRLAEELGLWVAGRARKPITAALFAGLLGQSTARSKH